jgi:16S rRNA (cytosine1402-N4)-methyltransferase
VTVVSVLPCTDDHRPVMLDEALDALAVRRDGVYVDGTFGRGGHSREIFQRLAAPGALVALDRDPQAVAVGLAAPWAGRGQVADESGGEVVGPGRFIVEHARFSQLDRVLDAHGIDKVDGVLLDLGVSSPQLDDPSRGFSFRDDGPLDMRMDPTSGPSVRQWLLQASVDDIVEVLRKYGEERFAVQIAAAIDARRRDAGDAALATTGELARLVADVVRRHRKKPEIGRDPATRAFQALRILVNQELEELALVLERAVNRLQAGGRLVVIAFHSLEDRIVKRFFGRESGRDALRDPVTGVPIHDHPLRLTDIRRVLPDASEVRANPRARSAVLRIATRTAG